MRWIVGDLQGCVRELELLLRTIDFDPARDQLWAAGDIINRGPDSLATVRLWRSLGGRGVLGNHEVYALCSHSGVWPRKRDTLDELFAAPDADELLACLRALPAMAFLPAHEGGRDVWLVHAGVDPRWRDLHAVCAELESKPHDDLWLMSEPVSCLTRLRCCTADGERSKFDRAPQDCPAPYRPWDEYYPGPALIVHGHWAWRGFYRTAHTIGLDSGCVYGGPLTAYCVEEDRVVQVGGSHRAGWPPDD